MRRFAFVLAMPLIAAGCATMPAPMASYVSVVDATDVPNVVPAIAGYVSQKLPAASSTVLLEAPAGGGWDPVTPALTTDLRSRGFAIADAAHPGNAHTISYLVSPLDGGVLIRISIDGADQASEFLASRHRREARGRRTLHRSGGVALSGSQPNASPAVSPQGLLAPPPRRGPGVRRLNRLPLALACGAGVIVATAVGYTYHLRAAQSVASAAAEAQREPKPASGQQALAGAPESGHIETAQGEKPLEKIATTDTPRRPALRWTNRRSPHASRLGRITTRLSSSGGSSSSRPRRRL